MKITRFLYLIGLAFALSLSEVNAQIAYEQSRSADTISYYVNNPYGDKAEFTWNVTGGVIAGHTAPYTAIGADTIQVIWNDSNKTGPNYGSLTVSEVIHWDGGSSCLSNSEQINVESWVRPKASTDTTDIIICAGESFLIRLNFEGKPGYQYKWKLYEKDDPAVIIEDHTADSVISKDPSADITIAGIDNTGNTENLYEFEVTGFQDGLNDSIPGDITVGKVTIRVQPKPRAGKIKSNNHLIRR